MKKRILSLVLASALCLSLTAPALAAGLDNFGKVNTYTAGQFTDVPADAWFAPNVQAAYELDLMTGSSDTTFNPNGNLTIAEALVLACRLHSTYVGDGETFTTSGGTWYQPYVDYAVKTGIITDGVYTDYTATATRAQFAAILAASLPDEALPAINSVTALPDLDASAAYAAAVLKLYNAGILTGSDTAGSFKPTSTIQRSEVATIVTRMADKSLRKTFTLTEETAQPQQPVASSYTLEDMQGTWYRIWNLNANTTEELELIIDGDQFTLSRVYTSNGAPQYDLSEGTITQVINDPDEEHPLALKWNGTKTSYLPKWSHKDEETVTDDTLAFFEIDLGQGTVVLDDSGLSASYTKTSSAQITNTVLSAVHPGSVETKYPMYADFSVIPDFGAIYDLETVASPTDGNLSSELEAWKEIIDQYTEGTTYYYYSAGQYQEDHDSYVPPILDIHFFDDYETALEDCGFEGVFRKNILGDLTFYYEGNGLLVSYDILDFSLGHSGLNAHADDLIMITIQQA